MAIAYTMIIPIIIVDYNHREIVAYIAGVVWYSNDDRPYQFT